MTQMKKFPKHFVFKLDFVPLNDGVDEPRKTEHFIAESMGEILKWMEPVAIIYSIELLYKEDGIRVIAEF